MIIKIRESLSSFGALGFIKKNLLYFLLLTVFSCNLNSNGNNNSQNRDNILGIPMPTESSGLLSNRIVFGFTEIDPPYSDPQILYFPNSVNMRAWQKWSSNGDDAHELNPSYIKDCHDKNILFMGGGTASILFKEECSSDEEFMDLVAKDATGGLVEHTHLVKGAYRGSLANPAFRNKIINYCKLHIDFGMDGVCLDEGFPSYNGATKWDWNGNDGYDDYFIKDFNEYLLNRFPEYTKEDWIRNFQMTGSNYLDPNLPAEDIVNNFNYREYLQGHGWQNNPLTESNPLRDLWGNHDGNRYNPDDDSFRNQYLKKYWLEIVDEIRSYARIKYNKEILVTSNGFLPGTDYHTFGLYNWNKDYMGEEVEYVPTNSRGELDATKSFKHVFLELKRKGDLVIPGAPLVLFLDWPTDLMNDYYNLSLNQKKDFWKIYASEAYACGLRYALHLRTTMPGEPTAEEQGVLPFLTEFADFFERHKAAYLGVENRDTEVKLSKKNITYNVTGKEGYRFLHLINHNYRKSIKPQRNLKVYLPLNIEPEQVRIVSPDFQEVKSVRFNIKDNGISFTIDRLESYNLIVIN